MSDKTPQVPVLDPEKLMKIDDFLEGFYDQSKKAGDRLCSVKLGKTQIRGLETIVASSTRFSQILNYIKNQAGKDRKKKWSETAPLLLKQLDQLEAFANGMAQDNPAAILEIKMRLARGWAGQVAAHYLYTASQKERGDT